MSKHNEPIDSAHDQPDPSDLARDDASPTPRGRVVSMSAGNAMALADCDEHSKSAASHLAMEERARQLQVKLGVAELLRQTAIDLESGAHPAPIGRPQTAASGESRAAIVSLEKEMVVLPIKGWTAILEFLGVEKKEQTRRLRDLLKQFSIETNGPLRFSRKVVLADPRELDAWTRVINESFAEWRLAVRESQSGALKARTEELPDVVGLGVRSLRRRK